jgi:hypothetical protein
MIRFINVIKIVPPKQKQIQDHRCSETTLAFVGNVSPLLIFLISFRVTMTALSVMLSVRHAHLVSDNFFRT